MQNVETVEITGLGSINSSAQHLNDLRQVVIISKLISVLNSLETLWDSLTMCLKLSRVVLLVLPLELKIIDLIAVKIIT